jgi:hypothetical protein
LSAIAKALKPTDREILALARRETDPREVDGFAPICRGRLFAVIALAAVGLAALPVCIARGVRGLFARDVAA